MANKIVGLGLASFSKMSENHCCRSKKSWLVQHFTF